MEPRPLISDAFKEYLESGLSITLGTRDDEMNPDGARGYAVRVEEDRRRLTVFVYAKAAPAILANLEAHPEIALALDRPTDNRACQLKGIFRASRRGRAAERAEVERQVDGFLRDLEQIGIPRTMTDGWLHWPCVALTVDITEIYEQTPGPGAGEPMR